MDSQNHRLHFLLVPLMSQSHIIPLTDFGKLLAKQGPIVTIVTTPVNATRFKPIVDRARKSGLNIRLIPLRFPCIEAGLPEGCENMDSLTSPDLARKFFVASEMLQEPLEKLIGELDPRPSCIVSTNALPWTNEVARKFDIPRYVFHTISCFTLFCSHAISRTNVLETAGDSDSEKILVPDMPHRIEFTKAQLPESIRKKTHELKDILDQMKEAERQARGVVVNSFEELEPMYVREYKKVINRIWCIGPVSQCNKETSDKFNRGNQASIDERHCLKWLDSMNPSSVIYACFGSLCRISPRQLIEIGFGLVASNRPFIWIIRRESNSAQAIEKWLEEERFEERVKGRGLVILGWAPQVLILSHNSVGGFLTHCGWNSTLEGISAGVPMITWPMFAEQFYNEKFIVHVLRIGVRVGVEVGMKWGQEEEEDEGLIVKREQVARAIEELMDEEGVEGGERRKRAKVIGEMAKKAVDEGGRGGGAGGGGSSYLNTIMLIQDVKQQITFGSSITA